MLQLLHWDAEPISRQVIIRAGVTEEQLVFLEQHDVKHFYNTIGYDRGFTVYVRITFEERSHWFNNTSHDFNSAINKATRWARRYIDVAPIARLLNIK